MQATRTTQSFCAEDVKVVCCLRSTGFGLRYIPGGPDLNRDTATGQKSRGYFVGKFASIDVALKLVCGRTSGSEGVKWVV